MAEPNVLGKIAGSDKAAWDKARAAGNFDEMQKILVTNFSQRIGAGSATAFVKANFDTMGKEVNAYGLDNTNPFFIFLKKYLDINYNIQVFLDPAKYNALHNLLANDIIDVTQLRDTCSEEKRANILWNKTLWKNSPDDIKWLVNTYLWFMNLSAWRVLEVSDNFLVKALKQRNDNTINTRYVLRSLCFFSTTIQNFIGKYKAEDKVYNADDLTREFAQIYYKQAAGKSNDRFKEIMPADIVEYQIKLLDELVQKNGPDATNYRETGEQKKTAEQKLNKDKIKRGEEVARKTNLDVKALKDKITNPSDLSAYAAYVENEIK